MLWFASARHLGWQVKHGDMGGLVLVGDGQLVLRDGHYYDQLMMTLNR